MDLPERLATLRAFAADGSAFPSAQLAVLAVELDLPLADLYAAAGREVPVELLPPERDDRTLGDFARWVTYCDHGQLAAIEAHVRALPPVPDVPRQAVPLPFSPWFGEAELAPAEHGFAATLLGMIRNRGFSLYSIPFMGLSRSTILDMVRTWDSDGRRQYQLLGLTGPLGWPLPELFALAGQPWSPEFRPHSPCRHTGRVYTAATHLTTGQLAAATGELTRINRDLPRGVWQPNPEDRTTECPDFS
ncbi:hypothetical protein HUT16_06995 [Kitasatospora sp. NA04385]|uniref:hypothetical protein n=1 Tax=Kitasatospora sp. NA04385 TaxID=2742135 RepID=UPI00158F9EAF|nr:hypothetical protein [Kitasatospora sp. NA04385]QKW18848.1 hypothetical protein HUT16_06995 [Kitasatospora sp. NA04385]